MKLELKVGQRFEAIDLEGETLEVVEGGLLKIVEPEKGKFVPKVGEIYWFVDIDGIVSYNDYECCNDRDRYIINHQPVFRTKEEIEEYKRYLDALDKYKYEFSEEEWKNNELFKWFIMYDYFREDLTIDCNTFTRRPSHAYFKSQEDAYAFINEAGEENVKRFMFCVWEYV